MKNEIALVALFIIIPFLSFSQEREVAFKDGEWLRYRMSYSGFLKAGDATLTLKETEYKGEKILHARGEGRTSSVVSWFFKVEDIYQSYFSIPDVKPYVFKRKIDEGGYKKDKIITFDHVKKEAYVEDLLKKKDTVISIKNPQDMISTFYFLRSHDTSDMKKGDEIDVDMFFDEKTYPFKLVFLGYETLKTRFGKIKTQKFRPLVQAGRVFKEQESVTIWITADKNKIPIKMKASLAVGSLRAELDGYKGLANQFEVIVD